LPFLAIGGSLRRISFPGKDRVQYARGKIELDPSPMSALGQKQTCAVHQAMSALPEKADMCGAKADVRLGPKAAIAAA
jgi:hypothetical protein